MSDRSQPKPQPYQRALNGVVRVAQLAVVAVIAMIAIGYTTTPDGSIDAGRAQGIAMLAALIAAFWFVGRLTRKG